MRVLISGAAGFLGKHVTRRLLADGFEVAVFDQVGSENGDVRSIVGDLRDLDAVRDAVSGQDVVCHIGAIGDVYLAAEHPELAAEVNVTGSANIALAAGESDARIVYASTWEVYGQPQYQPMDEDHPCRPDHPYNITKLAGEQLLLAADHLRDTPVISLRLGTSYGPGLRPNSVFRIFIDRAKQGEPITIQGDGSQGRQFTHTSDVAGAFSLACRSDIRGTTVNIVAPDLVSIRELAELVVARYPTDLRFGEPRPGDVPPALVSAERARSLLGWKAEMPFSRGLDDLMDELEEHG